MNLDNLLNMMEAEANSASNYILSSYEQEEAYEIENFLKRQGVPQYKAPQMAKAAVKNPLLQRNISQVMNMNAGRGEFQISQGGNQPAGAAQFDITIRRNTANIAQPLPVILFASQESQNGYRNLISGLLPAGTVLTSVRYGENASQPNALRFTFTEGVNVDTIDVICPQYPYPSFLQSIGVDMFRMTKLRYGISNTALTAQFNLTHKFVSRSMFGLSKENALSIGAYKRPDQFQTGIIDVDGSFEIDKESGILMQISSSAGFEVTWSMFVQKFFRQISKDLN